MDIVGQTVQSKYLQAQCDFEHIGVSKWHTVLERWRDTSPTLAVYYQPRNTPPNIEKVCSVGNLCSL